jgi:hypothetical protein
MKAHLFAPVVGLALAAPCPAPAPDQPPVAPVVTIEPEWTFPRLRATWRQVFRWSRLAREQGVDAAWAASLDGAEAHNDPGRAFAAHLALSDTATTPVLAAGTREALASAVTARIARGDTRWGPEPLWNAFLSPATFPATPDFLAVHLHDQWGEDDVAGNAFAAAEIYLMALQEDPAPYRAALARLLLRLDGEGALLTQRGAIASSLFLLHVCDDPGRFAARRETWQHLANGRGELDAPVTADTALTLEEWQALMAVMVAWRRRWAVHEVPDLETVGRGNRRMATHLVERLATPPVDYCLAVMASGEHHDWVRSHALMLLLVRSPGTLRTNPGAVAAFAGDCNLAWEGTVLALLGHPPDWFEEGDLERRLEWEFDLPLDVAAPAGWRVEAELGEFLRDHLLEALDREPESRRRLRLAASALALGAPLDRVAPALLAEMLDDDVYANASRARRLLDDHREEAREILLAGYRVAITERDWQMLDHCTELLAATEAGFDPSGDLAGIALMAEQLLDDDVEGNAQAAMRYLGRCGASARPALEALLDSGDEQAAGHARILLDGL